MPDFLSYYLNKIVTVHTGGLNRQYGEKERIDYFVGRLISGDRDGFTIAHPMTGARSYFSHKGVVGIAEEIELDPANPEHADMIRKYQENKTKQAAKVVAPPAPPPPQQEDLHQTEIDNSPFVDVAAIQELAKRAKSTFKSSPAD